MILGQLGTALLLASLTLALFGSGLSFRSGWRSDALGALLGRRAFYAAGAGVVLASLVLEVALVGSDFSLAFVAEHTDHATPAALKAAAFYGGQEGSLLYWALALAVLGAFALAAASPGRQPLPDYAAGFLGAILAFFLALMVFVSSPFEVLARVPLDGLGLNPLLRDGGMLIHPPFLLAGMASFAIPFSFAMAALLAGRPDSSWIAHTRRFALAAWALQSTGLLLGMWWAYHVLGWGGYWGWDAVENVALLPWLATTAYIHSSQVQERRGSLRTWNFALVILAFCLAIFGTFVVRSGIIQSVHSFAVSSLGPWFAVFLAVSLAASGGLLAWRAPGLRSSRPIEAAISREGAFYLNNLLLLGIAFAVLWGTVLPLLSQLAGGPQQVVGAAFYERVTGPLFLMLLALLAAGPLVPWQAAGRRWLRALAVAATVGAGCVVALLAAGERQPGPLLAALVLGTAAGTCILEYVKGGRFAARLPGSWPGAAWRLLWRNHRRYGAYLAHLGIVVVAAGIAGSHFWQLERQIVVRPGDVVSIGSYRLQYLGSVETSLADGTRRTAQLRLGEEVLEPGRTVYPAWGGQSATRVAIRSTPMDDLYVVLAGSTGDGAVSLLVFLNPMVTWVWAGGAILIAGVMLGSAGGGAGERASEMAPARLRLPSGAAG